ncbi:MAG TPA: hypothetical protein VK864_09905, partial [Longimicrobiales bacterium]|nr:hypothetical protein [Longimicrobiales bacterium]
SRLVCNERALHGLIRAAVALLNRSGADLSAAAAIERVALSHRQIGTGYGRVTDAAVAAGAAFESAGLQVDPTYTAKAAAEFLAVLRERPDARLLFWHTLSATMPRVTLPPVSALPPRFRAYLETATPKAMTF